MPAVTFLLALMLASSVAAAGGETSTRTARAQSPAAGDANAAPRGKARVLQGTGIARFGSLFRSASGYERFPYLLVGVQDAKAAARHPGVTLVYMSGTSIQRSFLTGVSYQEALGNDWLLKDAAGAFVMNARYGAFVGDVGNPAYQQRFVNNVSEFLHRTRLDGVFIDDVVAHPVGLTGGVFPAKYPTAEAWEAAMISFVSKVGRALEARGYYVLVNAVKYVSGDRRSDTGEHVAAFWRQLAPNVSGLMTEHWHQSPIDDQVLRARGTRWFENWNGWQALISVAQGAGADFFGLTYGKDSDSRAMRYARGSFLLDWNGRGGALVFVLEDKPDPYHPIWVKQIGVPMTSRVERAPGVWQRRYTRGIVVVNTTTAAVTVTVLGKRWTIAPTDALFARCACARAG